MEREASKRQDKSAHITELQEDLGDAGCRKTFASSNTEALCCWADPTARLRFPKMRNRLGTMDELLSLSDESCFDLRQLGANSQQLQQQELLPSPSRHRTRTRAIHVSLRNKAMVLSSMAAYFASVLLLWATWAVWRLRKSWAEAIASPRPPEELPYTSSDLARFECPLVDEAGSTPGPPRPEKNPPPSPVVKTGMNEWKRPLPVPRPPPVSVQGPHQGESMNSDYFAGHDHHHMIGLPTAVLSALNQTWPPNTACDDAGKDLGNAAATSTPEASPPSSAYGVLACGLEGGTAPASPESDRCCTRKSTIISGRTDETVTPAVLRSAGNTSSSCGLCGYTLEEGQEVVRSPACAQGFMVSRLGWEGVVCETPCTG